MTQNLLVLKLVSVFICLTYFLEHLWLRLLWALECLSRLTSPPSTCNAVEAPGLATNSFFCFLFVKQGHQQVCCARRRQQSLITVNRIHRTVRDQNLHFCQQLLDHILLNYQQANHSRWQFPPVSQLFIHQVWPPTMYWLSQSSFISSLSAS